jgi:hypothetical protein
MELPAPNGNRTGPVRRKPKQANKRRALTRVDLRYQIGRRVKELVEVFRARFPDPDDPVTAAAIARCAETIAMSEDLRARALRGEEVSPDDVLRASRTADLMTRRLQLGTHKAQPATPTLSAYLQQRSEGTP